MGSGGGPTFVISGKGGAQDARPVGGMGAIYGPITAELGEWFATERGHINFIFIGLLMAATYRGSPSAQPQAVDGDLA